MIFAEAMLDANRGHRVATRQMQRERMAVLQPARFAAPQLALNADMTGAEYIPTPEDMAANDWERVEAYKPSPAEIVQIKRRVGLPVQLVNPTSENKLSAAIITGLGEGNRVSLFVMPPAGQAYTLPDVGLESDIDRSQDQKSPAWRFQE